MGEYTMQSSSVLGPWWDRRMIDEAAIWSSDLREDPGHLTCTDLVFLYTESSLLALTGEARSKGGVPGSSIFLLKAWLR